MCKKGTLELWIKSGETVVGMECMFYLKDKIEAQNWNYITTKCKEGFTFATILATLWQPEKLQKAENH